MDPLGKLLGLDQYERAARLYPALLAVAPASATLILWAPDASALVQGAFGALATAIMTLVLMRYGRARGRAVQKKMIDRDGGLHSTIALRHRDQTFASASKARYHAFLQAKGHAMPDEDQEHTDPVAADDRYRAAADWLRTQTRDAKKFALLQAENRDYGFRRNLLGLKPLGLTITIAAIAANIALALTLPDDQTRRLAALILAAVLAAVALVWLFVVTIEFVADASRSYTEQLYACCDVLAKAPVKKGARSKPRASTSDA